MENIRTKNRAESLGFINKKMLLHFLISFLLGRVVLAECISPFSTAYLCSYNGTKDKTSFRLFFTALMGIAGIATTKYNHLLLKYLLAYVLFGLIYISFSTIFNKNDRITLYSCAFIANMISGIIYYAQFEKFLYNFTMLVAECVSGFFICFIISSSAKVICGHIKITEVKSEDMAGIYIISALIVTGFCGLYIGNISVGRAFCGLFIMISAFACGCHVSTTCGVGIGVLCSLYAFELNEYAGVFGFCGLCAGAMNRFRRPGVVLGFIVSAKMVSAYFGGWSDSSFTDFELIIAVCMFCLIPQSALISVKSFLNPASYKNAELQKRIETMRLKMKNASRSLDAIRCLSKRVFREIPSNIADLATIYDETAEKVCKTCGLKFACWGKEDFDTRDSLNKMTEILYKKDFVESSDVPELFRRKCIRHETFVNELNRTYCSYKISNSFNTKVIESQRLLTMELDGMSDIVKKIETVDTEELIFDKTAETKIYNLLEQEDIKCADVTAVVPDEDSAEVTVTVRQKNADCTDVSRKIEKIVSEVAQKSMEISHYTFTNGKYTFRLTEKEIFKVECSCISIPKKGEAQCGDTVMYGRIADGKYAVILSDGMGCGEDAARLSQAATELMRQFANAGFDKKKSMQMISSAIMINNTESFVTMDAIVIDLFTARAEYIKAGANTTYIKTDNSIKKISSSSLPIGILDSSDPDFGTYPLRAGDIIVMISDGIHSAADDWFEDYILNMHEESPDIIAQLLSDEAQRKKKQEDDMTVAVIKINKA